MPAVSDNGPTIQTIGNVHQWTSRLFSFTTSRPNSFRFRSGEFVMIGLPDDKRKPVMRAYSMANPAWEQTLEFYSIIVPDGPLTSRLQHIKTGDTILLGRKPTGTLVIDALTPAKRLYLFSTGTGIAPFISLIHDPETYHKFDHIFLTHTCRTPDELEYGFNKMRSLQNDPLIGEFAPRLTHYTSVTRANHTTTGRITKLIESGKLFDDLKTPPLDPSTDRAMICGSNNMISDVGNQLKSAGFCEGSNARPAHFVIERAFAG